MDLQDFGPRGRGGGGTSKYGDTKCAPVMVGVFLEIYGNEMNLLKKYSWIGV